VANPGPPGKWPLKRTEERERERERERESFAISWHLNGGDRFANTCQMAYRDATLA